MLTAQLMRDGQTAGQAQAGVQALVDSGFDLASMINPQTVSAVVWMLVGAALVIALEWLGHSKNK